MIDKDETYIFGDLLREFRRQKGMSQGEFGEKLGITRGTVYNWENGYFPSFERIGEIAQALELSDEESKKLVKARLGNAPIPGSSQPVPVSMTPTDEDKRVNSNEETGGSEHYNLPHHNSLITALRRAWQAFFEVPVEAIITPQQRKQNRQRMLVNVHTTWVKGVLKKSLDQIPPITLELCEQPDAIADPWRQEHREIDELSEPAPLSSTDIARIYDDAGGELLILGEAGSGKTTLLLKLTSILLKRAERNEQHPIPVFFNLSSWSMQELPLSEWLVKELHSRYQVAQEIGAYWLQTDQLLLLLDGLDEVAPARLGACIDVINSYRSEHGLVPMVLCTRSKSYLQQTKRIILQRAVTIQSLTKEQVDQYLAKTGEPMESVREALQYDQGQGKIAATPLMISILRQTDGGIPLKNIQKQRSPAMQLDNVFEIYVQRMLLRRENSAHYTENESMFWLTWLACQMKERSLSAFYLEDMQMSWLPPKRRYQIYPSIAVGLVYGLFFMIIKGTGYAVLQGTDGHGQSFGLARGLFDGLLVGICNTLLFVLLNGVVFRVLANREKRQAGESWRLKVINLLGTRFGYGMLNGLVNGILIAWLVDPLIGIHSGLSIGVIYAALGKLPTEISPSRVFTHWSWTRVQKGVVKFTAGGVFVGLLSGSFTAIYWQFETFPHPLAMNRLLLYLFFGLCIGLIVGLFIALMGGLSHDELDKRDLSQPNQAMWNSLWNSTISALFVWLFFGVFFGWAYGVILHTAAQFFHVGYTEFANLFPRDSGLMHGLIYGLAFAAFVWLFTGGTACILHLLLRFLLWRERCIPWRYARFLDAADEQLLLRKVGSGYVFVHLLLLEYFATNDASLSLERKSK